MEYESWLGKVFRGYLAPASLKLSKYSLNFPLYLVFRGYLAPASLKR